MADELPQRSDFPHFLEIPTRWMDQDPYGHVNNVEYYSFFDTVVNDHLIRHAGLVPRDTPVVGMVVETKCRFLREISFPESIDAGMRVTKLGASSIVYDIALFKQGDDTPCATGHFVHVYVDRATMKKAPVPDAVREAVESLLQQ
ncbi:MAG: thioesterase family protein [Alphaproteobacteria bacterium]